MTKAPIRCSRRDAEAGCREPFVDAELYDYEYRHRRADVSFYRQLARNRMEFTPGPVLDLACGSGRLLLPLARDGWQVIGLDRSRPMLVAAARRIRRLGTSRRRQCTLMQADLRGYALHTKATLAIAAFHSVQHLLNDEDFLRFLRATRAGLMGRGWLAFDVLPPDPAWLARDPQRRWGRTLLRHPITGQRLIYTTNQVFDARRGLLHMRLFYQPADERGRPAGQERVIRLCHRQYHPEDIERLLVQGGFRLLATFADFHGRVLGGGGDGSDEHVYVAVAA